MAAEVSPPRRLALPACGACRLFAAPTQAACTLSDGAGASGVPKRRGACAVSQSVILCNRNTTPGPIPLWEQTHRQRAQTDMLMSMRRESNCNTCHDMRTTRSRV
jgi:hypothetical protein